MSPAPATEVLEVAGKGLITGKPVQVRIEAAPPGHGIVFYIDGVSPIPARLEAVVHTDRGVTLADMNGKTLSIVEHFLCACSLAGLADLKVSLFGAPELPILDGSSQEWLDRLQAQWGQQAITPALELKEALFYRHNDEICIYAVPDTHFKVSYGVDFDHPDLKTQWVRWDSQADALSQVASATTFGFISELPALQAKGIGLGADADNTLGLIEEGGYSRPLRYDYEPVYHKILDLIGDLTLSGFNPLTLKAHVFAINAGHGSHTAFARRLIKAVHRRA